MFYMNWEEREWVRMEQRQKQPIDVGQAAMATTFCGL
jgi:hypothetical protein